MYRVRKTTELISQQQKAAFEYHRNPSCELKVCFPVPGLAQSLRDCSAALLHSRESSQLGTWFCPVEEIQDSNGKACRGAVCGPFLPVPSGVKRVVTMESTQIPPLRITAPF